LVSLQVTWKKIFAGMVIVGGMAKRREASLAEWCGTAGKGLLEKPKEKSGKV